MFAVVRLQTRSGGKRRHGASVRDVLNKTISDGSSESIHIEHDCLLFSYSPSFWRRCLFFYPQSSSDRAIPNMRAFSQATRLLFASLALPNFSTASVVPTPANLDKRTDGSPMISARDQRITYSQLEEGYFQNAPDVMRTHPASMYSMYSDRLFYHGKPIYVVNSPESKRSVSDLQQAVADFGGFHVRVRGQQRALSIIVPSNHGANYVPAQRHNGYDEVIRHIDQVDHTARTFGTNAALLANGWNARTLPTRRTMLGRTRPAHGPPGWVEVHQLQPSNGGSDLAFLRGKLDSDRAMRFTNDAGTMSFGVRAHPNGQIEQHLIETSTGNNLFHYAQNLHV